MERCARPAGPAPAARVPRPQGHPGGLLPILPPAQKKGRGNGKKSQISPPAGRGSPAPALTEKRENGILSVYLYYKLTPAAALRLQWGSISYIIRTTLPPGSTDRRMIP